MTAGRREIAQRSERSLNRNLPVRCLTAAAFGAAAVVFALTVGCPVARLFRFPCPACGVCGVLWLVDVIQISGKVREDNFNKLMAALSTL